MDLATTHPVDAIRIAWGEPYARRYLVQYWTGEDPIKQPTGGAWVTFQGGEVTSGNGGMATLRLASAPMLVRYLRIWMTQSSNTCDDHGSADKRNCLGYAIREIYQWSSLYDEPKLVSHILDVWRDDGVPPNVPLLITELNIAWNTGESFVDTFGALWLSDFAGAFFTAGGDGLYYFHYLPMGLYNGCGNSPGTFGMFTVDSNYQIKQYTSQYFASQLITQEWAQPGNGTHKVFAATSDITDPAG